MPPVWPVVADDVGDKITGTIWNKALHDAIQTYVDDYVVSAVNPATYPNAITDEVVTGRAAYASLHARFTAIEAGLPPAGVATLADLKAQQAQAQLVRNHDLSMWNGGGALAPDYFVLSGAGATVARTGAGEGDATTLGAGSRAVLVTSGAGAEAQLTQTIFSAADMTYMEQARSRKVVFVALVKCASANAAKLVVNDGVTTTSSTFHTGDGTTQYLRVVHTISGAATTLQVYLSVAQGVLSAYAAGFNVNFSDNAQTLWVPDGGVWASKHPIVLARWAGLNVGNVLAAETDIYVLPGGIPANAMRQDGQGIDIMAGGQLANNGNTKTIKLYLGAASMVLLSNAAAVANNFWTLRIRLTRYRATVNPALVIGTLTHGANTGATPTVIHFYTNNWGGAGDFTANQALKLTFQSSAASSNDIVVNAGYYIFLP